MKGFFAFLRVSVPVWIVGLIFIPSPPLTGQDKPIPPLVGMYVHQHWPYNHPYAARTWTLEDWKGYADGLKKLGYNSVLIWPVLETMPEPLTPSDRASLEKTGKVIDLLHQQFQMRVYIALCPNIVADNTVASQATFEKRHFFYSDLRVNPGDPAALKKMIDWREKLFKYLAKADGVAIIDSDPGGYVGSTNAEFVNLLHEHRQMFDRLRPGIELIYWMHVGWEAYCRWYETGKFAMGTDAEHEDALAKLEKINPEPWGLAGGQRHPFKTPKLASRVIAFNYGRIEGEPSFPLTNFGGNNAYEGGRNAMARGVMGNAQTHCVQLPNTFAFARGATGKSLTDADYTEFANGLITGYGAEIVQAWKVLAGKDSAAMRKVAAGLEGLAKGQLKTGQYRGLLFGSPSRFLSDLVMMLRMKAGYEEFLVAVETGRNVRQSLNQFVSFSEVWQKQHGYENHWGFPKMHEALRKLNSPAINRVLDFQDTGGVWFEKNEGATPFERIRNGYKNVETFTPSLLAAMKQTVQMIPERAARR
ncbi:MAG: hypothetical protein DMG09_08940 [Acidobacteria bacterium]|nr:MAG: hypothetical protein DMG09_08940 [Acidobacteriota bacterium]